VRLQRLVLSGFKTFAHRTEIRFEPGITGVVGPNGSGKSNLVDAVRWRWVRPTPGARGSRLDEMIFAGGQGRDRMGVAEVELILDNEDGQLPVDDAEVAISRRVVRGGDIEYRVNGERARLRDVERLLGGTGLTQHGYAVVAQHDIEAIIEATPASGAHWWSRPPASVPFGSPATTRYDVSIRSAPRCSGSPTASVSPSPVSSSWPASGSGAGAAWPGRSSGRAAWQPGAGGVARCSGRGQAGAPAPGDGGATLEAANEAETGYTERVDAARAGLDAARAGQRAAGDRLEAARVAPSGAAARQGASQIEP